MNNESRCSVRVAVWAAFLGVIATAAGAQTTAAPRGRSGASTGSLPSAGQASTGLRVDGVRDVSPILAPIVKRHSVPGMVAAVVQRDRLVSRGAAGVRRRSSVDYVNVDDAFVIGTNSKPMTAAICAMLVDEGKLSWESTPAKIFPTFTAINEKYRDVTLRQMLTCTAGMPERMAGNGAWGVVSAMKGIPVESRRAVMENTLALAPAEPPGSEAVHSDAGFIIAAHMAETVAQRPWEDLVKERFFNRLGMTSGGLGSPEGPRKAWGHASGGPPVSVAGTLYDIPPAIYPIVGVQCNVTDWARFISLLTTHGATPAGVLKPATIDTLLTPIEGTGNARLSRNRDLASKNAGRDEPPKFAMGWKVTGTWLRCDVATLPQPNGLWCSVALIEPTSGTAILVAVNEGIGDARGQPVTAIKAWKACNEAVTEMLAELKAHRGADKP